MRNPGNVPADLTSFVGRKTECREVRSLLSRTRLVCLTGVGGVGKTRVALRAAADSRKAFPQGVWVVELATLRDAALLEQTVAAALGLSSPAGHTSTTTLEDRIADWNALLVLDNCEHLVDACATLVSRLLRRAPSLRIITTSREPLRTSGEHVLEVNPLTQHDAVRLFAERAAAVVHGFDVTPDNAAAIARLCGMLDGIPLAIELAAARLRTLTVHELGTRLDDRFRLLSSAPRDAPARHRGLQELIDWSHALCSPEEQTLWARMSVFAGAVDVTAVEEVCSDETLPKDSVVDLVDTLAQKSVLTRDEEGGEIRVGMLDTIHEFGRRRLAESGREALLRDRHADYYHRLVAEAESQWFGPEQVAWSRRLRLVLPNLRIAMSHLLRDDATAETGASMAASLWHLWIAYGFIREGRVWMDRALTALTRACPLRAKALWVQGWITLLDGGVDTAPALLAECAAEAESIGDASAYDHAEAIMGGVAGFKGEYETAVTRVDTVLERLRANGDDAATAVFLFAQAEMCWAAGRFDQALACCDEGERLSSGRGEQWCGSYALLMRALVRYSQGELTEATVLARRSLRMKTALHDTLGILLASAVVCWAVCDEQPEVAARLHGAVEPLWDTVCSPLMGFVPLLEHRDRCDQRMRSALGAARYDAARSTGASMDVDQIVASALGDERRRQPAAHDAVLTRRETEVATLVSEGLSSKEIAARLAIAPRTVDVHVQHILDKYGFTRRTQLAAWATQLTT